MTENQSWEMQELRVIFHSVSYELSNLEGNELPLRRQEIDNRPLPKVATIKWMKIHFSLYRRVDFCTSHFRFFIFNLNDFEWNNNACWLNRKTVNWFTTQIARRRHSTSWGCAEGSTLSCQVTFPWCSGKVPHLVESYYMCVGAYGDLWSRKEQSDR